MPSHAVTYQWPSILRKLSNFVLDIQIFVLFCLFCICSSVVHSDEFRALPADEVAQLIGSDHLTVPSEEEVSPSFVVSSLVIDRFM